MEDEIMKLFASFRQKKKTKVRTSDYKTQAELTPFDLEMINMDRYCTGIENHTDEWYYNNILHYNFAYV